MPQGFKNSPGHGSRAAVSIRIGFHSLTQKATMLEENCHLSGSCSLSCWLRHVGRPSCVHPQASQAFHDPNGIPLNKPSMLKRWKIQRVHILRGCLSDPEVEGGILYRRGGTIQLNHVPGERAAVPVWIPIRGTSQQEGYHFHQAKWVTGTQVSPELFQAQAMTGVCRWNYQCLLDLKLPGVCLPPVFDPTLMCSLNAFSRRVFGEEKFVQVWPGVQGVLFGPFRLGQP
uniref:uncharacterized protein LOC131128721 n=1 Tax=Doryrhamphus excisus TaxID=161450 RepID=UPI0025AE03D0|nr:uncharacterized protein LOC131128721 [Doryrhamphus excisus]